MYLLTYEQDASSQAPAIVFLPGNYQIKAIECSIIAKPEFRLLNMGFHKIREDAAFDSHGYLYVRLPKSIYPTEKKVTLKLVGQNLNTTV